MLCMSTNTCAPYTLSKYMITNRLSAFLGDILACIDSSYNVGPGNQMYFDYSILAVITQRYVTRDLALSTESQIESICASQMTSWKHIPFTLGN